MSLLKVTIVIVVKEIWKLALYMNGSMFEDFFLSSKSWRSNKPQQLSLQTCTMEKHRNVHYKVTLDSWCFRGWNEMNEIYLTVPTALSLNRVTEKKRMITHEKFSGECCSINYLIKKLLIILILEYCCLRQFRIQIVLHYCAQCSKSDFWR